MTNPKDTDAKEFDFEEFLSDLERGYMIEEYLSICKEIYEDMKRDGSFEKLFGKETRDEI